MKCSLIITTYNWEDALKIVVSSALNQSVLPNEIIIADDGSNDKTKKTIQMFQNKANIPILHSWQEDKGFRAAKSRNQAIAKTNYDYIIIIDGDMILHKHFINNHIARAKSNFFIQGSRVLLQEKISRQILNDRVIKINFFTRGLKNRKNTMNSIFLANMFSKENNNLKGVKACNLSFWKRDIIKVNGFNEKFVGWGREDSELIARLFNRGVQRNSVKFNCNAFHLYHNQNRRTMLAKNDVILKNTIDKKLKFCKLGIDQYL